MKGLFSKGFTHRIWAFGLGMTAMFGTTMFEAAMFDTAMFDTAMFEAAMFDTTMFDTAMFDTAMFDNILGTAALAQEPACPSLPKDRPGFNSTFRRTPDGLTQVIGRQPDQHYGVIVPEVQSWVVLAQVQVCIPDAFWVESRLGPYVQSGFFYRRVEAEALSKALESRRVDARVIYYR
jgi:hypothetical protein